MSEKEFTKNDLKSGYVVETRDGSRYLVTRVNQNNFTKMLVSGSRFIAISCYKDDLTFTERLKQNDIVKVWGLSKDPLLAVCINNVENRPLLWERRELLNCKIVITKINTTLPLGEHSNLTVGKIYEIKNGKFTNDLGGNFPLGRELTSIDELEKYLSPNGDYSFSQIDFIKIVED